MLLEKNIRTTFTNADVYAVVEADILNRILQQCRSVFRREMSVQESSDSFVDWFEARPDWSVLAWKNKFAGWNGTKNLAVFATLPDGTSRYEEDDEWLVSGRSSRVSLNLSIVGPRIAVNELYTDYESAFRHVNSKIRWVANNDGYSTTVLLRDDMQPIDEMYPFIGASLDTYYRAYNQSKANILLLIGPPGTGKTGFIRGFLQHGNHDAILTYDPKILEKDDVFTQFIEGGSDVFILEDADQFLRPRDDGNDFMHRFLSVGDGLVSTVGKKMVFSTNLDSINKIDPALIRKGRCFDILKFRALTPDETDTLCDKVGIPQFQDKKPRILADIMGHSAESYTSGPKGGMGFLSE